MKQSLLRVTLENLVYRTLVARDLPALEGFFNVICYDAYAIRSSHEPANALSFKISCSLDYNCKYVMICTTIIDEILQSKVKCHITLCTMWLCVHSEIFLRCI